MQLKNTKNHFGLIAIILHWLMAFLIIGLLAIGLYMADLPNSLQKLKLYGWHKEFGFLVLMLAVARLVWRLSNVTPVLTMPRWEVFAARAVHWIFYLLMIAMPITGWLVTSAAGFPISFFGLFIIPTLIQPDPHLLDLFAEVHEILAYTLIAFICGHVLAALKHQFIDKDDILIRMF